MLWTWWQGDDLPWIGSLDGMRTEVSAIPEEIAELNGISLEEAQRRMTGGHRAYIGYLHGTPVTYGWVARQAAEIGELDVAFGIPGDHRYLWDFATQPEWRGRGLYPRLLQAIVRAEAAGRFWVINAPENAASASGIRKAGFAEAGHLSVAPGGGPALFSSTMDERSALGAQLLGVRVVSEALSPCWRCAQAAGDGCPLCRAGEAHDCQCVAPAV
jgi:GNAT superfamily N-acetyltransferase